MKSNDPERLTRKDFEGSARRKTYENFIVADEDLSHIKLGQETVFRNGRFERVNLDFAMLEKATFEDCTWYGVSFKYGKLKGATFQNCLWRSAMIEWSDFRQVVLESVMLVDPVRVHFCALNEKFYPIRHPIHSGYIRGPQTIAAVQEARKAKLAELAEAAKLAEAQSKEAAAKTEFEALGMLPTSELLRLFQTSDDPRVAEILDRRIGVT